MTEELFPAEKVYIALRPMIFDNLDDQHVTVEYLGNQPKLSLLERRIAMWQKRFHFATKDLRVEVTGYANWRTFNAFYEVALVRFADHPRLNFMKNWHITMKKSDKPLMNKVFVDEERLVDFVDTLWVGYKVKGEFRWCPAYAVRQVFQQLIAKQDTTKAVTNS